MAVARRHSGRIVRKLRRMLTRTSLIIIATTLVSTLSIVAPRAAAAAPVEITWMLGVGPDRPMYEELLRRFHTKNPAIRVRPMWVPASQYQTKLKTLIAAGKPPDMFWSGDVWVAYQIPFLADLSDLVARDAAELDLDDFYPELLAACRYDGKQILMPRWFNVALLYYNRKLFDEAGEPYPTVDWTWDDYIAAAKRLTRRDRS